MFPTVPFTRGWYYLYIIAWKLCRTMKAEDMKNTLDMSIAETGVEHVQVVQLRWTPLSGQREDLNKV